MCEKLEEVKKDIAELELLQKQATRQKVKDILSIEIRKLVSQSVHLVEAIKNVKPAEKPIPENSTDRCYEAKLNNYAWDQSNRFLKLYVTVPNVQNAPAENVKCTFSNSAVELNIKALDNKNYSFTVKNLLYNIDPSKSSWKVKTDMVAIMLAKVAEEKWSHVTQLEKKASDHKKYLPDKIDDSKDPNEQLMNMMKKMYETGDDELKRSIAKAWTDGETNRKSFLDIN